MDRPPPDSSPPVSQLHKEMAEEIRDINRPMVRTSIPMDGICGLGGLVLIPAIAVWFDVATITASRGTESQRIFFLVILNFNAIVLWMLFYQTRQKHRRVHRFLRGRCPDCGYDLRASGDTCPECGKSLT